MVLPRQDGFGAANVSIFEAIRLSLQCHLAPEVYMNSAYLFNASPTQHQHAQAASGREVVGFFDAIGDLVDPVGLS